MLFRNRELRHALYAAFVILAVGILATAEVVNASIWAFDDAWLTTTKASLCILLVGAALIALFGAMTRRRYKSLERMAQSVDEALHAGRSVSLADMREGELAILASEVDKALTKLTIAAEELNAEKISLADSLANISHQLRTPLTSLGLTLDLARKRAMTLGDQDLINRMRTSENLLSQVQWLVEALLKLARIDAGAIRLNHEHVDVADLVREAMEPLEIAYELAGVTYTSEIQTGCSFIGDRPWTCEALRNVLKNCLEHMQAGGTVEISASDDLIATRIEVRDSGTGIDEEDLPHVFERFYRGKHSDANAVNPSGVGIGLSLSQALIAAQDGRITASNNKDASGQVTGAKFSIVFPKGTV